MGRLKVICVMGILPIVSLAGEVDGRLVADGNSEQTYQLITSAGYMYECPDVSRTHSAYPFQHIQQTYDEDLDENVFQFFIHAKIDDDRGIATTTDRQRNEIKTWAKSPAFMVGQQGDSLVVKWKFKLPLGMMTTKKFTHVHQLKGIDNAEGTADVSNPLITFTCCSMGSGTELRQVMQVRYMSRTDASIVRLAEIGLDKLLGRWIEVEECFRVGEKGCYSLRLTDVKTSNMVAQVRAKNCNLWCAGSEGIRPKWGIYRYIGDNRSLENELRDEELRFADFSICKVASTTGMPSVALGCLNTNRLAYDVSGRVTKFSIYNNIGKRMYIYKGKKVLR